jgi:hypothetical protein
MRGTIAPRSTDTTPDAERVQVELLRAATVARRLHLAWSLSADVLSAARRALARAKPQASRSDLDLQFVELHYGRELANELRMELVRRDGAGRREA